MNTERSLDMTGWQVPSYDSFIFQERVHRYALVVPVINEGERIRDQLRRTAAANLPVDIIIADGGSTDGSLDPGFLEKADVRALLIKTGPGRLSAQLRMAYSWCLLEGYTGIVTIDGNGKDNVEGVRAFTLKLDEGFDYIQGSRYLAGGGAIDTPLERTIGNRFIHAPILSLVGHCWYTDTTSGFRAYSSRYLLDKRVQPFRHVFNDYELLFYLTVRAGQVGARIDQVPTVRKYPKTGRTPTKISGLRGKLDLLRQTFDVALGRYNPSG